jgi:integrase/recombinase XerC
MSRIESFLHYLEVEKRYSSHTILAYENDLNQFAHFAEIKSSADWSEANHQLIRGWIVALMDSGQTNKSVARKLSSLRSFYKWQTIQGLIELNPMLKIRAPKVEKRLPQFVKQSDLEPERIKPLFGNDFDGVRDRLMFELFYQTGIRLSELLSLTETAVNDCQIKVIGKRNKERIIPIGQELFEWISYYRKIKPDGPDSQILLFVNRAGRKLSPKFVYRKINNYLGSATNVQKKSPHVLRHTFATHLLNNGAGLETLKELLGHANLSATQVYTHNSFAQINSIYSQAHPRGRKK